LIDADGTQVGIIATETALRMAKEQFFDLVEVAPEARPPVCRIMDFGKFLYQQKKKTHDSRKKQKTIQVKEVKFRPNIDDHDYSVKLRNAVRFLDEGDKVKATVQFRGREMSKPELGLKLLRRFTADLGEQGSAEGSAEMAGNRMHMIFGPGKKSVKKTTDVASGSAAAVAKKATEPAAKSAAAPAAGGKKATEPAAAALATPPVAAAGAKPQ
jgi:translation initiation factor IF-3